MLVESLRGRVERSEARPDFRRCCRVLPPKPLKHRGLVRQISRKDLTRGSWAPPTCVCHEVYYTMLRVFAGDARAGWRVGQPLPHISGRTKVIPRHSVPGGF